MTTNEQMIIIADDLTGAADAAAAAARAGASAEVRFWDAVDGLGAAEVIAVTTESRDLHVRTAVERFERALELADDRRLFIKIDSLMRGHVAEMLAALSRRSDRPIVLAPAHPRQGRRTRSGRQYADGSSVPLQDLRTLAPSGATVRVCERSDEDMVESLVPNGLLIIDAEDPDDLVDLVARVRESGENPVWVGSAGLAAALAVPGAEGVDPAAGLVVPHGAEHLLLVVGSASDVAARQSHEVATLDGAQRILLGPVDLVDEVQQLSDALRGHLAQGPLVVGIAPPEPGAVLDLELAEKLAAATAPLIDERTVTVLVGGALAAAVLQRTGMLRLTVRGEADDGIPILTDPRTGITVITKAGAFGDVYALFNIASKHMRLHQKGILK